MASSYLGYAPEPMHVGEWLFARIAFISNFTLLYLIPSLFLFFVFIVIPRSWIAITSAIVILGAINVLILIDITIFKLFRFHLNSLVLNVLMTEGSSDSVKLGFGTVLTFLLWVLLILSLEIGIFVVINWLKNKPLFTRFTSKKLVYILLFLFVINVVDKAIYAYCDLFDKTHITRYSKLFPLYQPLTIKRYAKQKWGFEVNREFDFNIEKTSGILNYPLRELEFAEVQKKLNIVLIVIDSWRYDMLSPEVTPNIYEFSKEALKYSNHYSGGNATRFGLFSLFYGLYGSYWHSFLSERLEPVLIKTLRDKAYAIKIISSTQLTFPEFRKTIFIGIPDCVDDQLEGEGAKERDPLHAVRFSSWLDTLQNEQPFFAFFYLDAPHLPYSYPDEFIRFRPSVNEINFMLLDKKKDVTPYFNHYKNAIYFDDSVVGDILNELHQRRLLETTAVMITGDHGAEFYERGFWGHNGAFSPEQAKVPFIFYLSGQGNRTIKEITSHSDVPPTLLELIGCTTPAHEYSVGQSLIPPIDPNRNYIVSSSWSESAMIDKKATIVFSTEIYNIGTFEVRNNEYEFVQEVNWYLKSRLLELREVMVTMSKFYR